jgi:hypothetical protein
MLRETFEPAGSLPLMVTVVPMQAEPGVTLSGL